MKVYAQTDRGRVRSLNEDSYYAPNGSECFCAIADGMGGHNAGEVASRLACMEFSDVLRISDSIDAQTIAEAVRRANHVVFTRAQQDEHFSGMGTTFTALAQDGKTAWFAHVGDSRLYLIRGGKIEQVTHDHTLVQMMVDKGTIDKREAKYHPKRNYITRALGTEEEVEADIGRIDLEPGDIFFLCTDGLSNHTEEAEILNTALRGDCTWQEKVQTLVERAIGAGSTDNVTAMLVRTEEDFDQ